MKTWIAQPPKSKICGPIAVAVIAEVSVDDAVKVIGKRGATTTKQLANGLRKLGYECPSRLVKFKLPLPSMAIAKMVDPERKSGWHWVAISDGRIYDGINGKADGTLSWKANWRMTSYLPITKV